MHLFTSSMRWLTTLMSTTCLLICCAAPETRGASTEAAAVVMNEINYNSSDAFNPDDWIEFLNRSSETVDLSGWVFKDEEDIHGFFFPQGTQIAPNTYIVVCRHLDQFTALFPDVQPVLGEFGFGLSGGGEVLRLYNKQSVLVDSVFYDDKSPWPSSANGRGTTLQLVEASSNNALLESWKASDELGGSPGRPNNPRTGNLVINEFMAQNTRTLSGPDGEFSDWIELHNLSDMSLNLEGVYLTHSLDDPRKWDMPDTTIAAHGYLIVWGQSANLNTSSMQANFRLSKDGEQIGLYDRDSWHNTLLDSLTFGPQSSDVSMGRLPDGTGAFQILTQATPNAQNGYHPSDFDANGTVGFSDFLLFVAHYGLRAESPQFDTRYDLDQSGNIDFSDFLSFVHAFGK